MVSARLRAAVLDLDDTLVDTRVLRPLRDQRRWREAVSRVSETRLFDGVREFVELLEKVGVTWVVVTTSVSYYAKAVLTYHELGEPVLVAYHDAPPKPNPAGVLLALQRIGASAQVAVGLGDAAIDQHAYRAAGIPALGAGWSPTLAAADWDAVLSAPADICQYL